MAPTKPETDTSPVVRSAARSAAVVVVALLAVVAVAGAATVPATAGTGDDCAGAFDLDGPRLFLPASEDATVEGAADLGNGSDARVVVVLEGEASPRVVENDSVTVDEYGNWRATVDLSGVEEGREFVATLERDGDAVETVRGEVGHATATVAIENQTVTESERGVPVVVRQAHLELGGFVAIHRERPTGDIVGVSEYLPPGTHENVTVELDQPLAEPSTLVAMPHLDTDCDRRWDFVIRYEDLPYWENGTRRQPVTDAATVTFPTQTPSPASSPTPGQTPTPTRSVTPTDPATATASPEGATGPGFGIGPALVAAAVGGYLLRRRR